MHEIDQIYTKHPFYGSRRIAQVLSKSLCIPINRKRVQRLMRTMGLAALFPKKSTTRLHKDHKIYPYLLRNFEVTHTHQVYSSDITYIPVQRGFLFLVDVMDWFSRYIVSWEISNTMHIEFCLDALDDALRLGNPEIVNTDQGSQFTSPQWVKRVEHAGALVSMDGKGRALDNVWIERFWRSLKYEEVYLKEYANGPEAVKNIGTYIRFYNTERPHQSLNYRTPEEVFKNTL